MGNRTRFKRAYGDHRDEVRRIFREWREECEKWEGYQGSELGDKHIEEANNRYAARLENARKRYHEAMDPILSDMRKKLEESDNVVVPPNDDMLRVLKTVEMMPEMEMGDYLRYLELVKDNTMARKTLWKLAQKRVEGGDSIKEPSGGAEKASLGYTAIRDTARALGRWDGSSRSTAVNSFLSEARDGIPLGARHSDMAAPTAGELDATSSDFERKCMGIYFNEKTLELID